MNVVVCGTFDLFHEGHEELLYYADSIGNLVKVFVTSNEFVADKKILKQTTTERMSSVAMVVDCFVQSIHDKTSFQEAIKLLAPCIVLHGNDHNVSTLSEIYGVEHSWWIDNDIYLLYKDRFPGISSTELRKNYE